MSYTFILTHDLESMTDTYKKNLIFLVRYYESKLYEYTNKLSVFQQNDFTEKEIQEVKEHINFVEETLIRLNNQQIDINNHIIRRLRMGNIDLE